MENLSPAHWGDPERIPFPAQDLLLRILDRFGRAASRWAPPAASAAALVEYCGCLLTIERSDGRGLALPGGLLHWRESAVQAVTREVREETGFCVLAQRLFGVYSDPERDERFSAVVIVYEASII